MLFTSSIPTIVCAAEEEGLSGVSVVHIVQGGYLEYVTSFNFLNNPVIQIIVIKATLFQSL